MVIEVTDANFDEIVVQAGKPAIVDFWAEWCGPCRMIGPIIKDLSEEYGDKITVAKLDVDSNPMTPGKYGIRNIPTVLYFKDGELADKQVGVVPKPVLAQKLYRLL